MRIVNQNFENFMAELNFKETLILESINLKNDSIFTKHLNLKLFYKSNNNFKYTPSSISRVHLDNHINAIKKEWLNIFTPEQLLKFKKNEKSADVGKLRKNMTDLEINAMEKIFDFFEKNPKGSEHMLYMFSFETSRKYIDERFLKYYKKYSNNELNDIRFLVNSDLIRNTIIMASKLETFSRTLYSKPLSREISPYNFAYVEYRIEEINQLFQIANKYLSPSQSLVFKRNFFEKMKITEFLNDAEITFPQKFVALKKTFDSYFSHDFIKNNKLISNEELQIKKTVNKTENAQILISVVDSLAQNSLLRTFAEETITIGKVDISFKKVSDKAFVLEVDLKDEKITHKDILLNEVINVLKNIELQELDFIKQRTQFILLLSNLFESYFRQNKIENKFKDLNIEKTNTAKPKL